MRARSSWTRGQGARLWPEPLVGRDGSVQRHVAVAAVDIDRARGRLAEKEDLARRVTYRYNHD
jgi:hypothetical protein